MKAFRIVKYNERHEDQSSRRVKRPKYCQAPVAQNSRGWKKLKLRGEFHAIGVYTILFEFAATLPIRGVFADEQQAYSLDDISCYTDIPFSDLEQAVATLTHESVGFIDQLDWPVDPRLIQVTRYRGELVSRIILPWSVIDGSVFDQMGRLIDQDAPLFEQERIETEFCSNKPPMRPGSVEQKARAPGAERFAPPEHEHEHEYEPEKEQELEHEPEREGSGSSKSARAGSSGSDSGGVDRAKARQLWRLKVSVLFAPRGNKQHLADDTSASRLFDDHLWPVDDPPDEARSRCDQALALIPEATKRRRPMAWLTDRVKKLSDAVATS